MAKQEIKQYVEGRLRTCLEEYEEAFELGNATEHAASIIRVKEVLRFAAFFKVKTRHILNESKVGDIFKKQSI